MAIDTAIDAATLVGCFSAVALTLDAAKGELSALDGAIGDADHGVTMSTGFSAVARALGEAPPADPATVFALAAKTFLNEVGASSGPLYATAFMRAGAAVKGKAALGRDDVVAALEAAARGIADRGKASPGEKTMLDAWAPAADAARRALDRDASLAACLDAAATAAAAGAEATKTMPALRGRASRLGDRALGHMDPGAASAALILRVLAERAAA